MIMEFKTDLNKSELKVEEVVETRIEGQLFVNIINGRQLKKMDLLDDTDCYCQYFLSTDLKKEQVKSSKVIENNLNPEFNDE
jgi:Ca2+-dependent lipid-binding protein